MADVSYGSLPFAEQVEFFRRKLKLPTTGWTDVYTHEHDWAFVVAGANRDAIVADFYAAVQKAIEGGGTLEEFRRDFDRIVATHGWDYNGGRDWRSRVIYETNLATSYAAGRWQQLQAAPFWQYEHADWVTHPRHDHLSWDGLILERENPWWKTHFPPNGWGCQCSVRGLWPQDLARLGKAAPDKAPEVNLVEREIGQRSELGPRVVEVPEGIDPGFEYAPGRSRMESAIPLSRSSDLAPIENGGGLPGRPENLPPLIPRRLPQLEAWDKGQSDEYYVDQFLAAFGVTERSGELRADAVGERIVIGEKLFQSADGSWKAKKFGRDKYLPLLAETLKDPDEVWARIEWIGGRAVVRRRYISAVEIDDGSGNVTPALAVFERDEKSWEGVTTFSPGTLRYLDKYRQGVLLYRRK